MTRTFGNEFTFGLSYKAWDYCNQIKPNPLPPRDVWKTDNRVILDWLLEHFPMELCLVCDASMTGWWCIGLLSEFSNDGHERIILEDFLAREYAKQRDEAHA